MGLWQWPRRVGSANGNCLSVVVVVVVISYAPRPLRAKLQPLCHAPNSLSSILRCLPY